MAVNGDRQKKEIPGRKEGKKIKADEDQDRREQRDTDTLRWVYVRLCVRRHHANTHMHARSVKVQPSEMSNVRFSSARNMRVT